MSEKHEYIHAGRLKKAYELARVLFRRDVTVAQAKAFTDKEWIDLADGAGQKVPSFTTRALTIEKLTRLYDPEAA